MIDKGIALLILASSSAFAAQGEVTAPAEINKILVTIPFKNPSMPYKNIAERLPNLGLKVNFIQYGRLEKDEVKISQGLYITGDELYQFFTNEPNAAVTSICPIFNSFSFIKRGKEWIPDSRTANFIQSYKCVAP